MAIQITAVRLEGGPNHEHITRLWWTSASTGQLGENARHELVAWIENQKGTAYTDDGYGHRADVAVITPSHGEKYLRTHADRVWTNNLLQLPRR